MQILILSMLFFLVMGIPIGYAIGLGSVLYVVLETDISLMLVAQQICTGFDSLVLLAFVPDLSMWLVRALSGAQ